MGEAATGRPQQHAVFFEEGFVRNGLLRLSVHVADSQASLTGWQPRCSAPAQRAVRHCGGVCTMFKADGLKDKGNAHFAAKRFQEAIDCYTEALQLKGPDAVLHSNRSAAHLGLWQS